MKKKQKTKYTFYESQETYAYYYDTPSSLDPLFARAFTLDKDLDSDDLSGVYAALLLSLARKNHVGLIDRANGDVFIHLKHSKEELTPCEKHYHNLLVRHAKNADHISMKDFQDRVASDYQNTESFTKKLKTEVQNIGVNEGYFQSADYKKPKKDLEGYGIFLFVMGLILVLIANPISLLTRLDLAFGAFFILGFSCIISFFVLINDAQKFVLLTPKGANELAKWKGFYNFLNDESQIQSRTSIDTAAMEEYLIYATAFGLADKLNTTLSLRFPEGYENNDSIIHNRSYRSGRIHSHSRSFHSSVRTASYGGYSGGGGYGGGGRGGGGGGGGH